MQSYGSLERKTPKGYTSTWHFINIDNEYFAIGGCHKALAKRFDNIADLRIFYKQMLGYGYAIPGTAAEQLELCAA